MGSVGVCMSEISEQGVSEFESFSEKYGDGVDMSNPEAVRHICVSVGGFSSLESWLDGVSESAYADLRELVE